MRRANRVEPVSTGSDAGDLARATVTTTTHMEFVRRIQVVPMVSECEYSMLNMELNCCMSTRIFFFFSCSL